MNQIEFTWSPIIGLARAILALGTLITLISNDISVLFPKNIAYPIGINKYSIFNLLDDHLFLAKIFSISILIVVILGIYPRFTAFFHWYVSWSFLTVSDVIDGGDHVTAVISLLLIPILLFDSRQNHWNQNFRKVNDFGSTISSSFFFLIRIQVCVIYLHSMVGKLSVYEWVNGTATYYWLTHEYFGIHFFLRPFFEWFLGNPFFVSLITWGELVIEFLIAAAIVTCRENRLRYFFLVIGILFHFSIFIFHGLSSFFFAMLASLILYLVPNNFNYRKSIGLIFTY